MVRELAQQVAFANRDARDVLREEMRAVEQAQALVTFLVEGERGDDADAQTEFDVGLDDVRVEG